MPTKSIADAKIIRLQADAPSSLTNLTDLEWNFYSPQSGLTPASKYSITDHKMAYYKLQGAFIGSLRDIETAYFKSQGAVGASYDDIRYDFYNNRQFFLPNALANLELWLESDNISGAVLASDNFDRSKNLLAGNNPSFENGMTGWGTTDNGTVSLTVTANAGTGRNGGTSARLVNTAAGQDDFITKNGIPCLPNTVYILTAYVNVSVFTAAALGNRGLHIETDGTLTVSDATITATTTGFVRLATSITTPANATVLNIRLYSPQGTVDWDDIQLELGSKATAFVWGDATHLGTTDQGVSWTASAAAGVAGGTATLAASSIAYIDSGIVDHVVSIDTSINGAGQSASPLLRGIDATNFIFARYFNTTDMLEIWKMDAGVATQLANSGSTLGAGASNINWRVVASAVGNVITLTATRLDTNVTTTLNATLAGADATKFNAVGATRCGWRSNNTGQTFDNFSVKTPIYSDGAALPVWPDKSGYARHALQSNAAKQPLWRNASPNLLSYNQSTIETDTSGFSIYGTASNYSRSVTQHAQGTASLLVAPDVAATGHRGFISGNLVCSPGDTVSLEAAILRAAGTGNIDLALEFRNAGNGVVSTVSSGNLAVGAAFTRFTFSAVVPAGAASVNFVGRYFGGSYVPGTDQAYFDSMGLYKGNPPAAWVPPVSLPSSKPAVQFDGLDDVVVSPYDPQTIGSIFILVKKDATRSNDATIAGQNASAANGLSITGLTDSYYLYDGTTFNNYSGMPIDTGYHNISWSVSGGNATELVDGGNSHVGSYAKTTMPTFGLGGLNGNTAPLASIAAALIFSRVLTTTERQSIERYLRNKYGTP